jgi:hypothetical protein
MASLSNIALSLSNGSVANTRNVTITGTIQFDGSEVGKSYRLEIKIFGQDKVGDQLPSTDSLGDDELYTFSWGSLFIKKPYKQFTVAVAGSQSFTETRAISDDTLDEDSGLQKIGEADIHTPIYSPRQDEVYARVSLSGAPISARSATVIAGLGV